MYVENILTYYENLPSLSVFQVLVIPSFFLSQSLISSAVSPVELWSALVYGLVLTGQFLLMSFAVSRVELWSAFIYAKCPIRNMTIRFFLFRPFNQFNVITWDTIT